MTRINCIEPQRLTSKHLVAEYREMLRLRHVYPRKSTPAIPGSYRLGKGHLTFFCDKGAYLVARHAAICTEMRARGFATNYTLDLSSWPDSAMGEWVPTVDDKLMNMARILRRLGGG